MRDLPSEIFNSIFQNLEQKDLQTCYFVCKSWYYVAIPLNWGEVTLQNSKISLVISYLNHLDHSQYFKYGHLITKLKITDKWKQHNGRTYRFSKPELLVLLGQLPNLKKIDISPTRYAGEYIGFLLDADLKHISEISTADLTDSYYYDLLFLVYYRFRDTIASQVPDFRKCHVTSVEQQHQSKLAEMELALRLMQKVGKVDSVLIHFNFLDQYEVQPNEENKMTKYFKLLNAFRGTRQTYCKAKFTELDIQELSECIFHCDSSYGLYTAYCMYDNDFHGPDNADLDLPDRTSSIIGPEIFDNLEIVIFRDNSDLKYQYLKYSFLNCPELQSFELHYYAYRYGEMVSTIKYTHNKENPIGSDQPNYEIDLLEIEHIIPDQHFFNLVTTYLKDIEVISFEPLQWGRLHSRYESNGV
ncbi:hypothetical protein EDC94DRAFT_645545 [Helicostylum pulchrum]|nr:hypothetical protein EDC94DRAFT_645545 [Helicostylum pulchrum]